MSQALQCRQFWALTCRCCLPSSPATHSYTPGCVVFWWGGMGGWSVVGGSLGLGAGSELGETRAWQVQAQGTLTR